MTSERDEHSHEEEYSGPPRNWDEYWKQEDKAGRGPEQMFQGTEEMMDKLAKSEGPVLYGLYKLDKGIKKVVKKLKRR